MKIFNKLTRFCTNIKPQTVRRQSPVQAPDIIEISGKQTKITKAKNLIKSQLSGFNKSTVKQLEKMELQEFITASRDIINKTYGIPPELASGIQTQELPKKLLAIYDINNNIIFLSPNAAKKKKSILFSILKHEMQHQKQSIDIFRTEGLGEKWVEYLAGTRTENEYKIFTDTYKNMKLEDINKLKTQLNEEGLSFILDYKKALKDGKEKEFIQNAFKKDLQVYKNVYENFRQQVLMHYPPIKNNSIEAANTKKYFDGIVDAKDKLGKFKTKYLTIHETEALFAQYTGYFEYICAKFLK